MGLASLSALALVMVACGGSSSSTPAAATNQAPSTPVIVGPTTAITLHPAFYNLSATDPEGDAITFTVTGTGFTGLGNSAILNAAAAGTSTITVVAKDSKGAASSAQTLAVQVAANRAPQFLSQANGQFTGVSNAISWTNFQVTAQDPDTDDVAYSITGTPTFVDNVGTAVTGGAVTIAPTTGLVSFTGAVPAGKTSVTATFTVQAVDKLPGSGTVLGATATQIVTLTYFNGNLPPSITTSSLPNLPTNHYIPFTQGGSGFALQATDPNGDAITWSMTTSPNGNGLVLDATTGNTVNIISGAGFVPLTSTAAPITVNVTATDARGLSTTKVFTISVIADSKPTINSTPYTETVSGVKFFDKSQVKDQITSRARFYPGVIGWIGDWQAQIDSLFAPASAGLYGYVAGEANHAADALANDTAFSVVGDQAVAGWTARTIFRDSEGDSINYIVDARSVYVSAPPFQPVGQPFTLTSSTPAGPADVYPLLKHWMAPLDSEFPTIAATDGTMTWLPVIHWDMVHDSYNAEGVDASDNVGDYLYTLPSVWSFTVMGYEKVWNPITSSYSLLNDAAQAGRIDYSIKVQPNNKPMIGALETIPGSDTEVLGNDPDWNMVVDSTSLVIGGGATLETTEYGRPSIQEPESRRYDVAATFGLQVGTGGFDYGKPNSTPAAWRWLITQAGGDYDTATYPADIQIYDPDMTTVSGHADAIHAAMGTPKVPTVDTTGNIPVMKAGSKEFYNPWIDGFTTNVGTFEVNWGPNRTQYLIARITGTASYSFPVSVRDQYERINNSSLGINPIFGTVRFANARIRQLMDGSESAWANGSDTWDDPATTTVDETRWRGALRSTGNEGDNDVHSGAGARYTFSYLPFPSTRAISETDYRHTGGSAYTAIHLFDGTGPASGTTTSGVFSAASWITLYATEYPAYGFHQGNPLNDEYETFNLPSYAQGHYSAGGAATASWQNYSVSGGNPAADTHRTETGLFADTEYRAQVIPSSSPYLFSIFGDKFRNNFAVWLTTTDRSFAPLSAEMTEYNRTAGNANFADSQGALTAANWQTRWWTPNLEPGSNQVLTSTWYYGKRQGELDYGSATPGRATSPSTASSVTSAASARLRWTYTWPTLISNANLGREAGGANKYELGDVLQIAVPNMATNARWFFTGDGNPQGSPANDPRAAEVQTWGRTGLSGWAQWALNTYNPAAADSVAVNGATSNISNNNDGFIVADTTPFHVVTNSIWVPNESAGTLNVPNRTTFSSGVSYTELNWVGSRGYINRGLTGFLADPALQLQEVDFATATNTADRFSYPGLLSLKTGKDKVWFSWMKQDPDKKNAWGTWAASQMVLGATYSATGGLTTVAALEQSNTALTDTQAQVSFASGNLPGVNNPTNFGVLATYNTAFAIWQRSQWAGLANGVSRPSSTRLVNPTFDYQGSAPAGLSNSIVNFFAIAEPSLSRDGGIRDSAVIYGVRKHADAALGAAGLEPGSLVLAQWWNLQETDDAMLTSATVASGTGAMTDVAAEAFPAVMTGFYNPMVETANAANYATVMEFKVNFVAGVVYPGATTSLYKVPASVSNIFPLTTTPLTDPSCTNTGTVVDMGRPVVTPIRFLAINDYAPDTTATARLLSKIDLVNSNPSDFVGTGVVKLSSGGFNRINSRSNTTLTWQSSVNNQVLPSGYIVELYQLFGDATTTFQPMLLGSFRMGHIGGKEAIQVFHMPAAYTWRHEDNRAYFFRVRTVWMSGIDMEKAPNKMAFPMATADFVSAPFVTFDPAD
jgi:hypothetical protein